MSELSWARLVDVGVTIVDQLYDTDDAHEHWIIHAPDGSTLIRITRQTMALKTVWHADIYRPGPRPPGGTSGMRSWVFDWSQMYDDAARLLDDVAAIAG